VTLGEKQRLFTRLVPRLLTRIHGAAHDVALGWAYRPPECAEHLAAAGKGIRSSLHTEKLAVDLDLFYHGTYLSDTEAHRPFGEYWESLHALCRWGGRWGDGNHYSMEHNGRK
jgi:hypothetical protein